VDVLRVDGRLPAAFWLGVALKLGLVLLLLLPPLTDVAWNTLDAYDRIWWWDDANHLVNAMVFAAVIGLWAGRYPLGQAVRFTLALGLSMTLQVAWEIGEYRVLIAGLSASVQGYEDTIGDRPLRSRRLGAVFALLAVGSETVEDAEPEPVLASRD
jgi:hypothetical protein